MKGLPPQQQRAWHWRNELRNLFEKRGMNSSVLSALLTSISESERTPSPSFPNEIAWWDGLAKGYRKTVHLLENNLDILSRQMEELLSFTAAQKGQAVSALLFLGQKLEKNPYLSAEELKPLWEKRKLELATQSEKKAELKQVFGTFYDKENPYRPVSPAHFDNWIDKGRLSLS